MSLASQPPYNSPLELQGRSIRDLWETSPGFLTTASGRELRYFEPLNVLLRADEMYLFEEGLRRSTAATMIPAAKIATEVEEARTHFSLLSKAGEKVISHAYELNAGYDETTETDPDFNVVYSASILIPGSVTLLEAVRNKQINKKRVQKEIVGPTLRYFDRCLKQGHSRMLEDISRIDDQRLYIPGGDYTITHDIDPRTTDCTPEEVEQEEIVLQKAMQRLFE